MQAGNISVYYNDKPHTALELLSILQDINVRLDASDKLCNDAGVTILEMEGQIINLKAQLAATEAALWEVIDSMRLVDQYHMGAKDILEKHGVKIPDGKVVW